LASGSHTWTEHSVSAYASIVCIGSNAAMLLSIKGQHRDQKPSVITSQIWVGEMEALDL
jgi:hypothetical protein